MISVSTDRNFLSEKLIFYIDKVEILEYNIRKTDKKELSNELWEKS